MIATPRSCRLAAALALSSIAPAAWAETGQACTPSQLAPIDAWLAKHPWKVGGVAPGSRVDVACKASPVDRATTIVAAAYDQDSDDNRLGVGDKNVIVALVQPHESKLRSVLTGTIAEDAAMRVGQGSLRIDTARYDLAPGVRAFGVDVSSQAPGPRCADGGFGPLRTLFVQDGASLRPVLASVVLTTWRRVSGSACADSDDAIIENTATTIAVAPQARNGFADLVLASTVDGHAAPRLRTVLHYDGHLYGAKDDRIWPDVIVPDAPAKR